MSSGRRARYRVRQASQQVSIINEKIKKKPNCILYLVAGLTLNLIGAGLLYYKAQMDKDVIRNEIDKKLAQYGVGKNGTDPMSMEEIEEGEPSSIILVVVTMAGRMTIVVGTIKIFKGLEIFISDRRKKKLRETAEKLQSGETDTEWTELFSECCAF
ncbi:hypothetical protein PMAYCL1PPCAC_17886 [Pristionchus mayeri]|uniref:Uncharacterized protein n=1 Tax=Pristionchus mayeri TaxID=1317129 RepID=A0AAN5CNF5_9BILA|nr:hypothetical protein PMAYCL1PPCAC_17886 [Pristionchus mayeri]